MVVFPNCKINLGLSVLDKRPDGFHNIETIFYPVGIKDALEVITAPTQSKDSTFSSSGLQIDGDEENNLCIKAYQLLKKDFPSLPPIKIHLHKNIPIGAGLGGGSADGAFTLLLLNQKFNLGIYPEQLINYALALGSDCPFFITNQPALAQGRGEILQPVQVNLSAYKITLVNPQIHIDTAWAFKALSHLPQKQKPATFKESIAQPATTWRNLLFNDFEEVVFTQYPVIKTIKEKLYEEGAIYASMTGSGSTVFGLFPKEKFIQHHFAENYFVQTVLL